MPRYNPTPEQIQRCQARLEYFENALAKTLAGENKSYPLDAKDHAWCVEYYRQEVADRTLLLALWEHLLDAGEPRQQSGQVRPNPASTQ